MPAFAYNRFMDTTLSFCRSGVALLTGTLAASLAFAQPAQTPDTLDREPIRTLEQRTERIVHLDSGSRIEELRVGGQTRSIDVETNSRVPGYQVQPMDPSQVRDGRGSTPGKSSWRVLRF